MHSGNHWNQQEIEKNRATLHHENDRESASPPNQRSQVTKLRHQNMPVDCQGMHRADVPAVNRFEGTSSSKKRVSQDHRIVRKVRKRTDDQYEVLPSLPWDLRTCVNVDPGYFRSRLWARFSVSAWSCCALTFGVMARARGETPKFWSQQRFHSRHEWNILSQFPH